MPIQIEGVCSDNYNIVFHIDLDNDLDYDLQGTGFFEGVLPIGNHRILYLVEDGCNNQSQIHVNFKVKDCKKPTAVCKNGLIVELMQTGMLDVCASSLNDYSYDNCPGPLKFSFSSNVLDTCMRFNCLDLGVNPVKVWVTDAAGNQDFCETFVVVQDNMFSCGNGQPIIGFISTSDNDPLESVEVRLNSNSNFQNTATNADGQYIFGGLNIGDDYTVTPKKDDDPANGVSTFDLVLISKHILGSTPLGSPYKLIAADANNSKTVTTFDLVEIRKLILHMNDEFPNNTSWRFVDANYQFPNPNNPWAEVFPEIVNINDMPGAMNDVDFVAVKIGDVNESASGFAGGSDTGERSSGTLTFEMDNLTYQAGEEVTAIFKATTFDDVYGFQFTIDFNKDLLAFKQVVQTTYTGMGNFGTTMVENGFVTTSWETNPLLTLASGTEVIQLKFTAKAAGSLSEAIGISSSFTPAEAYIGDPIEVYEVALQFNNGNASASNDGIQQGYMLYQNMPNPFNKRTSIAFQLPTNSEAVLTVYDALGKVVTTIAGQYAAGYNEIELDRNNLPSEGLLYYRLEAGSFTATRSMTVVR
ncbi:MAG: T9SS type A sorting domain-containing protein [Saprospiraceae bacterium]|nr:T9SS type A sorting domain-containing protein [Saprospiraceae bacterium]